jgi:hypothetical protein
MVVSSGPAELFALKVLFANMRKTSLDSGDGSIIKLGAEGNPLAIYNLRSSPLCRWVSQPLLRRCNG